MRLDVKEFILILFQKIRVYVISKTKSIMNKFCYTEAAEEGSPLVSIISRFYRKPLVLVFISPKYLFLNVLCPFPKKKGKGREAGEDRWDLPDPKL